MKKYTTIAYVDGYNLYHGIIDRKNVVPDGCDKFSKERPWGDLLWLNLEKFINSYNLPYTKLEKIKFFEAPSFKPDSLKRQQIYKNALLSLKTIQADSFYGGEFKPHNVVCLFCEGAYIHHTEKRTDVSLAVELVSDFYTGVCESAVVVSGDADQCPAVEKILLANPDFKIYIIFPPHRRSKELALLVGSYKTRRVKYDRLLRNQFNDSLLVDGFEIKKPIEFLDT